VHALPRGTPGSRLLDKIVAGKGEKQDVDNVHQIGAQMETKTICALADGAACRPRASSKNSAPTATRWCEADVARRSSLSLRHRRAGRRRPGDLPPQPHLRGALAGGLLLFPLRHLRVLGAHLIAILQILVYAGAVMVLFCS